MEKSIYTPESEALQRVLQQLRHEAGLTQEQLAERIDEPQPFVSRYESGQRALDLIELRWICRALGVSLLELVRRFEEQLPPCNPTPSSSPSRRNSGRTSAP